MLCLFRLVKTFLCLLISVTCAPIIDSLSTYSDSKTLCDLIQSLAWTHSKQMYFFVSACCCLVVASAQSYVLILKEQTWLR